MNHFAIEVQINYPMQACNIIVHIGTFLYMFKTGNENIITRRVISN